jgi:hypothetical protein
MIPTPPTYRERLKPWRVIRNLPKSQSLTMARFGRRNDAESYLQALRRLTPTANYVLIFDVNVKDKEK